MTRRERFHRRRIIYGCAYDAAKAARERFSYVVQDDRVQEVEQAEFMSFENLINLEHEHVCLISDW